MATIARVKPIFRRRSGVRKIRAMALNKGVPPEKVANPEGWLKDQGNSKEGPDFSDPSFAVVT
jgi:hypothetical protein